MKILVDAMGGDHAPNEIVLGAIQALNENKDIHIILIGNEAEIRKVLENEKYDDNNVTVIHAADKIENNDSPVRALKAKPDASMVIAMNMLKDDKGDVMISAGNTGALVAGGTLIIGKIEGVERPALTTIIPTRENFLLLLDAGANTMCKPENYLEFALMGSHYAKQVMGREDPKIYLLNVGEEENKGPETLKSAYKLLTAHCQGFCGNIEGRDVVSGKADVIVCDGYAGNIALKVIEGTALFMTSMMKEMFMKNVLNKLSALVMKSEVANLKQKIDYAEYGGAPLLGIKKKVIKCHGSSDAKSVKNAILRFAINYGNSSVIEDLKRDMKILQEKELENNI